MGRPRLKRVWPALLGAGVAVWLTSCLYGGSASEEDPPQPAGAYLDGETFSWAFNSPDRASCRGKGERIDFDNTGTHPLPEPGEPDFGYFHSSCVFQGPALSAFGQAYLAAVDEDAGSSPQRCHLAAIQESSASPVPRSPTAKDMGITRGAAFCLVTDQRRVVFLRIDRLRGESDSPTPALRGKATLWVPRS